MKTYFIIPDILLVSLNAIIFFGLYPYGIVIVLLSLISFLYGSIRMEGFYPPKEED